MIHSIAPRSFLSLLEWLAGRGVRGSMTIVAASRQPLIARKVRPLQEDHNVALSAA
jgi:hypothetical protein